MADVALPHTYIVVDLEMRARSMLLLSGRRF